MGITRSEFEEFKKSFDGDFVKLSESVLALYREEGNKIGRSIQPVLLERSILSTVTGEYPHAFSARKELLSLRFLHLNPTTLRQPSPISGPSSLDVDGSNLPTVLARMKHEDEFALTDVSRDIAYLVPGISKIHVKEDGARNMYDIWAETSDKRTFSAQALSDGTLRLLALATLRNDPQFQGTLCLEEPENGVHPSHLNNMLLVLRTMITDFNDPQQADEPLQQVLVTTHSPLLISQPAALDSLLLTLTTTHRQGKDVPPFSITRMVPVITSVVSETSGDKTLGAYSIDIVRKFLERDLIDEAEEQLKKAKFDLYER